MPGAFLTNNAGNRGTGGEGRAHQMGASAPALAAFKVAVRGRSATFARREDVRIHAEAHGAARFAPFKASLYEDVVQAFRFGLCAYKSRARNDHGADAVGDLRPGRDACGFPQIFNARIGA